MVETRRILHVGYLDADPLTTLVVLAELEDISDLNDVKMPPPKPSKLGLQLLFIGKKEGIRAVKDYLHELPVV